MKQFPLTVIFAAFTLCLATTVWADINAPLTKITEIIISDPVRKNTKSKSGVSTKQTSESVIEEGYEFFADAMLIAGDSSSLGETLGPFRVVTASKGLPKEIVAKSMTVPPFAGTRVVVRDLKAGNLGLADGELIIRPKLAADMDVILQQYRLELASVGPSGIFFTARVRSIGDLPSVFSALLNNSLVEETDLSVNYFDQVPN